MASLPVQLSFKCGLGGTRQARLQQSPLPPGNEAAVQLIISNLKVRVS